MTRRTITAAALSLSALALPAAADVIIGNFNAGSGTGTAFGANTTTQYKAVGFTMPGTDYTLDNVTLTMTLGSGGVELVVSIWSGATLPTTEVAVLTNPPLTGTGNFVFTPASPVVLAAGQTYWVHVRALPGATRTVTWDGTSPSTVPTGLAAFVNYIFNGNPSTFRNRFEVNGSEAGCYPDCDTSTGPGVLDVFDFLCFQNRYDAGSPYACDCDTSTGPGVCDVFDFLCFQNAYDAGCP